MIKNTHTGSPQQLSGYRTWGLPAVEGQRHPWIDLRGHYLPVHEHRKHHHDFLRGYHLDCRHEARHGHL